MRTILLLLVLPTFAFATTQKDEIWHKKARDILEHAVNIPTVLGRHQVPKLAQYFAKEFRKAGIPKSDIRILRHDDTATLIVRWRAEAEASKKAVMVMGHMDIVEAKRADWSMDPFKFIEKDGYYYGRGTSDMKGGLAAITAAILKLKATGFKPSRDIVVFFSGDEETVGLSALKAATVWWKWIDAEYGLNADSGGGAFRKDGSCDGFGLQTSEKSYSDFVLSVTNPGGHSSKPRADNAIYQLAAALKRLEAYRFEPVMDETTRAYFSAREKDEKGPLGDAMRAWLKNPNDGKAADLIEADPLETGLTRTRCVATRLFGGHADNALPQLATATVNCRIFPGISPESVRLELERIVADPGVVVTRKDNSASAAASPLRPDVLSAFTEAVHSLHPGVRIIPSMIAGATDGVFFRREGIPVYGADGAWGVSPDDDRAHGRDERLAVQALADNVDHWAHMLAILTK